MGCRVVGVLLCQRYPAGQPHAALQPVVGVGHALVHVGAAVPHGLLGHHALGRVIAGVGSGGVPVEVGDVLVRDVGEMGAAGLGNGVM